ncbi:hypothetical protein [Antiquaquibacter soli]|uniref:Bacteriocin biosynthesis cyclodehydratase domain-containing protein n=1 Tax=Antiquaquibacter soli TaxID=3064523 RepID=A0ABT9BLM4_9MICO|nr:hypothetical protein [Protaetiibacter sp. WY-16]MDO7881348.1 hypothetical protein [Protaetiibacter sp. WY-16]
MILKLDPRWPLVWRDPATLQIGIDPPRAVLGGLSALEERLVAALAVGVPRFGLEALADGRSDLIDALLERLSPVLSPAAAEPTAPSGRLAITGSGALADAVTGMLRALRYDVEAAPTPDALRDTGPDLAIAVGRWVLDPRLHSFWLRRDTVHLPVVSTDSAVHIGPVVEPGDGPCLLCLELHRRDGDVAWPAIASQLLGRSAGAEHPVLVADAATAVVRLVQARLDSGPIAPRSVRLTADGERADRLWHPHPECGCRGIGDLVSLEAVPATAPRGSGSASGSTAPVRPLPTRARDGAALA